MSSRCASALVACVTVGGCALPFVETPVPAAVRAELPLPDGWAEEEAGCAWLPGAGTTCLLKGRSSFAPGAAVASTAARAQVSGWAETSWDRVPGRIQSSFQRGEVHVGLAAHDELAGSQITISWTDAAPLAATPAWSPTVPNGAPPGPDARLPPLSWPEGTEVLEVGSSGPRTMAHVRLPGDPDSVLDVLGAGLDERLRSRSPTHRALQVVLDGQEVSVLVSVAGEPHDALVSAWPALP